MQNKKILIVPSLIIIAFALYFTLNHTSSTTPTQPQIDTTIDSWSPPKVSFSAEDYTATGSPDIIAEYKVTNGKNLTLTKGKETPEDHIIWQEFLTFAPPNLVSTFVNTYNLRNDTSSRIDATMGEEEEGTHFWAFKVNKNQFQRQGQKERVFTIIHELSHLLTLNETQQTDDLSKCTDTEINPVGCPLPNSIVDQFYQKFWKGKTKGKLDFDPTQFVTEYATDQYIEDLSESFATFVFEKAPQNTNSIRDQKVAFFYQFPEFVKIRGDMRVGLYGVIVDGMYGRAPNLRE
jgi:hypothetical protein